MTDDPETSYWTRSDTNPCRTAARAVELSPRLRVGLPAAHIAYRVVKGSLVHQPQLMPWIL